MMGEHVSRRDDESIRTQHCADHLTDETWPNSSDDGKQSCAIHVQFMSGRIAVSEVALFGNVRIAGSRGLCFQCPTFRP